MKRFVASGDVVEELTPSAQHEDDVFEVTRRCRVCQPAREERFEFGRFAPE
jgi:hypothetical protein